jgi:Ca2+-binding RTX toxin-like protein
MATITGTAVSETLTGTSEPDVIDGLAGNDLLIGNAGNDTLRGGDGEDTLNGGAGDDLLDGGINTLGATFDRVDYAAATGPVNVNLATGVASGAGIGTDTLVGIEGVQGSSFDDTMIGASTPDYFHGGAGNDYIEGGDGFDLVTHFAATSGINLNFATGTVVGSSTGTDTLVSIEGVLGTNFDDSLVGAAASEFFRANAGNDTIDGAAGIDTAAYDFGPSGSTSINANLLTGIASGTGFGTDTLIRIENLRGGNFDDTLIGDNNNNSIAARSGNDTVRGNGGDDSLSGEAGNDSLFGGDGTDTLDGGAGDDVLDGGGQLVMNTTADGFQATFLTADVSNGYDVVLYTASTAPVTILLGADGSAGSATGASIGTDTLIDIEYVAGGSGNDLIRGSNRAVNEILSGGPGDDTLYGGAEGGVDQALNLLDYRFTTATGPSGVNVNLQTGTASGAAGNDVFSGFIGVLGSPYDDTVIGAATNDFLEGGGGNDSIDGGDGFDIASFSLPTSLGFVGGVTVDLSLGQASGAQGTDQLLRIEGVRGSSSADILRGNAEPNVLQGREGDDLLEGGAGADTLMGGTGSDTLDGGAGLDVAAFLITRANADVIRTTAGVTVSDKTGNLGSDALVNIERVHFTDTKLALDLAPNQAAAQVALLIGVLLPVGIAQPSITGALMPLADAGFDASGMAQTLVDIGIVAALAGSNQPSDIARLAARNVLKTEPAPDLVATLAGFMNGALATLTPAQFIGIIANLELNQEAIGLVGLQQSGLAFA